MTTCKTGKVPFESWEVADRATHRRNMDHSGRRSIYRCKWCGKWHVGTHRGTYETKREKIERMEAV